MKKTIIAFALGSLLVAGFEAGIASAETNYDQSFYEWHTNMYTWMEDHMGFGNGYDYGYHMGPGMMGYGGSYYNDDTFNDPNMPMWNDRGNGGWAGHGMMYGY